MQSVLKRHTRWVARLLEYELNRFTEVSTGIILPAVLIIASLILSSLFTILPSPVNLENALFMLIAITILGVSPTSVPITIGGPSMYYFVSPYLLDILSPLPHTLKGTISVLLTLRLPLYTYMYTYTYFVPVIVASLAAIVMIFSSLVREEDFFLLVREDRNRVQVFRGVLYAFVYSLLGVLTVFIVRAYLLIQSPLVSFLRPVFDTFCPILTLIPVFFVFLLAVQGVASFFNHFSSRLVYLIPVFLLIELLFFQFPISFGLFMPSISDFIRSPEDVLFIYDNLHYFLIMLLVQAANKGFSVVVQYLPLFNLSEVIHTFVFGYSHGLWNYYFFDPNSFLYSSAIRFNDNVLFNPAFSNVLPSILFLNLLMDVFTKPFYTATGSLLYFGVPIVLIHILNAIIFGRKTI